MHGTLEAEGLLVKRKVIQLANSTLVVSLPHKWVAARGVKKGDELDVDLSGPSLIIAAGHAAPAGRTAGASIGLDDLTFIRSYLGALYRAGVDEINLRYDAPHIAKTIQEAVTHLIGFEVMEQKSGSCVIRSVIREADEDFSRVRSKLINLVKAMHQILVEDLQKGELGRFDEVEQCRFTAWKFRDFGHRILLRREPFSLTAAPQFLIVWLLEKITRNYNYLYLDAKKSRPRDLAPALPVLEEVAAYFDAVTGSMEKADLKAWEAIYPQRVHLRARISALLRQLRNPDFVAGLEGLVQKTHDMSSAILMTVPPDEKVF